MGSRGPYGAFCMDAVAALGLETAKKNDRGTGSAQYPPSMMLGFLIWRMESSGATTLVAMRFSVERMLMSS